MKLHAARPVLQHTQPAILLSVGLGGCTPIVDVSGVYFPGWLVSAISGVVISYGVVFWLGRRPAGRDLADSGLFFIGLVAFVALSVWWLCFSDF